MYENNYIWTSVDHLYSYDYKNILKFYLEYFDENDIEYDILKILKLCSKVNILSINLCCEIIQDKNIIVSQSELDDIINNDEVSDHVKKFIREKIDN